MVDRLEDTFEKGQSNVKLMGEMKDKKGWDRGLLVLSMIIV